MDQGRHAAYIPVRYRRRRRYQCQSYSQLSEFTAAAPEKICDTVSAGECIGHIPPFAGVGAPSCSDAVLTPGLTLKIRLWTPIFELL